MFPCLCLACLLVCLLAGLFVCSLVCLLVCLFVFLLVCWFVCLLCLSVCCFFCLSIHQLVYLYTVCLSNLTNILYIKLIVSVKKICLFVYYVIHPSIIYTYTPFFLCV